MNSFYLLLHRLTLTLIISLASTVDPLMQHLIGSPTVFSELSVRPANSAVFTLSLAKTEGVLFDSASNP